MTAKLDRDLDEDLDDDLGDDLDDDIEEADVEEDVEDGAGESGVEDDPPDDPPDDDGEPPARGRFLGPRRISVALGVVAALLVGTGAWALFAAAGLRDSPAARNSALVDTGRTAEVSAAVTSALNQIFSYSYDKTDVTDKAAKQVLRGDALTTYDKLFAEVRAKAPEQKLVLTTRVVYSAVRSLEGDRAQLFVFLDQSATRVDTNTTSSAAAQLSITAKREGGRWVITDMVPR
jgi:Mce-associated membrane protein